MKIHILTDDRVKKRGFLAEHGMSIYIEHEDTNILFDTGQTDVYCRNAIQMGLDLSKTNHIVLSHGHYDHCGGLVHFPMTEELPNIYVHEAALCKRYALNPDKISYREIGIPWKLTDYNAINKSIKFVKKNVQITSNISLVGEIPSLVSFEGIPEGFFINKNENMISDMIKDEQMLIFDTDKGLVLFLGCSHPGIINCLTYISKLFPDKAIYALIAGMHLESISPLRLQMTIQSIIDLNIQKVIPLHCTGIFAICEMKKFLDKRCSILTAGDSIEL